MGRDSFSRQTGDRTYTINSSRRRGSVAMTVGVSSVRLLAVWCGSIIHGPTAIRNREEGRKGSGGTWGLWFPQRQPCEPGRGETIGPRFPPGAPLPSLFSDPGWRTGRSGWANGEAASTSHPHEIARSEIKELSKSKKAQESLVALSTTLRDAGNIGAHFDSERDPDRKAAETMIDLIEYLLEYVFVLPERIRRLAAKLDSLGEPPHPT